MGSKPTSPTIIQQAPVPTPAPPATTTSADTVAAGMDIRQQEMLRKNIKSTIRAGDTGGFMPGGMMGKMPGVVKPAGGNPFVAPQGKF